MEMAVRHHAAPDVSRGGFTLVELVIVMVIIGVVGAIALPRFSQATARQQLDAAAERLVSDLELAKTRARASSQTVTVAFNRSAESYTISGGGGDAFTVELDESPYNALIGTASFGGSTTLTFNGYGIPSSSGTVVVKFSSSQKITVNLSASGEVTR